MTLFSVTDAAELMGVSIQELKGLEAAGQISPQYTTGGHRRYEEKDILKFIKKEKEDISAPKAENQHIIEYVKLHLGYPAFEPLISDKEIESCVQYIKQKMHNIIVESGEIQKWDSVIKEGVLAYAMYNEGKKRFHSDRMFVPNQDGFDLMFKGKKKWETFENLIKPN